MQKHLPGFISLILITLKKRRNLIIAVSSVILTLYVFLATYNAFLLNTQIRQINDQNHEIKKENSLLTWELEQARDKDQKEKESALSISLYDCDPPKTNIALWATDKKYYAQPDSDFSYYVCNAETKRIPGEISGRSQNKHIILISYAGSPEDSSAMFVIDTKAKTLNYITSDALIKSEKRYVVMAPSEDQYLYWSPGGTYVLLQFSPCWGCMPGQLAVYAYNLSTAKMTYVGDGIAVEGWPSENTLKWTEQIEREVTEEEYQKDPWAYPIVVEPGQTKITKLD